MNALLLDPSPALRAAVESLGLGFEEAKCSEKLDYKDLGTFDLVVGAPRLYADDDRSEDEEFEFAIDEIRPKMFILEMPRGFASPRYRDWTEDLVDDLAKHGYNVGYTVAPVDGRKRTLVIGVPGYQGSPRFGDQRDFIRSTISKNLEV